MLPMAIFMVTLNWFFHIVTDLIQPLTNLVIKTKAVQGVIPEIIGDVLVVAFIALVCFLIGSLVSTSVGRWLHSRFDKYLLRAAPGYKLIKEIVRQFLGDKADSPFTKGEVARVNLFGLDCETTATAIVTSRHTDGCFTVFVPTGPNPTSGNMYHLPPNQVQLYPEVKVEDVMRTIIACGAGSGELFHS